MAEDGVGALLDLAHRAATAYGRPDLADAVARASERRARPDTTVVVAGEFKKGKSSLVNGLVQLEVCAVDADLATAVPTTVRWAAEPEAHVVLDPPVEGEPPERRAIAVAEAAAWSRGGGGGTRAVDLGFPRKLLEGGLVLVDTPGVGGLVSAHTAATLAALPLADAVLLVTDATSELSAPEVDFLRLVVERCPVVVLVVTKVDLQPDLGVVLDRDGGHLAAAGLGEVPIVPVSSSLRAAAVARGDRDLNVESGYAALVERLRDLVARRGQLADRTATSVAARIVEQLQATFAAERAALADPDAAAARVAELQERKASAERLQQQSARWATALSDGVSDLTAEADHLVRARLRAATAELDALVDGIDPRSAWHEVEAFLSERVALDVAEVYRELQERTDAITMRVLGLFELERTDADPALALTATDLGDLAASAPEAKQQTLLASGLTALRGTYSGFLMFGLIGQLAGLALATPFALVLGLVLGGKALRDERERALTAARQQAKNAARKHLDDVSLVVTKDVRDAVRQVHRTLRDHFAAQAANVSQTATAALRTTEEALRRTEQERAARLADVEAELARLGKLAATASSLLHELGR